MDISLEKIVAIVVEAVVEELVKKGYSITSNNVQLELHRNNDMQGRGTRQIHNARFESKSINPIREKKQIKLNLSQYKTPLITERQILDLEEEVEEIIVPKGTLITPGAGDLIRRRNLLINN